jgi:hypothetical protein
VSPNFAPVFALGEGFAVGLGAGLDVVLPRPLSRIVEGGLLAGGFGLGFGAGEESSLLLEELLVHMIEPFLPIMSVGDY